MNILRRYDADVQREIRSLRARLGHLDRQLRNARRGLGSALLRLAERNDEVADKKRQIRDLARLVLPTDLADAPEDMPTGWSVEQVRSWIYQQRENVKPRRRQRKK